MGKLTKGAAKKPTPAAKVAKVVKVTKATGVPPPTPPPTSPPPPPPPRDELLAPRDIARLLRYGEMFGANRIDVRMLPMQLPVTTGALAILDPAAPKSYRVFDRPTGSGTFRVMLSVAGMPDGKAGERLAAIVIHMGRPPIARWTVAHHKGSKKPKSADVLPRTATSGWLVLVDAGTGAPAALALPAPTGVQPVETMLPDGRKALAVPCGEGEFAAYWAIDANDKPICLVIDFEVFTQKDWKAKPPKT